MWLWTEEYIWHKRNCWVLGKWPNRFRDAWERGSHFTKARKLMNQEAVMVPMGDWAQTRLKSLGKNDVVRHDSQVGNSFAKNIANWQGRDKAYPTNVLHLATECANKGHSAAFPKALPEWFIKLFTNAGDVVLDPFVGSGTTVEAACELSRVVIGIDVQQQYVQMSRENWHQAKESCWCVAAYQVDRVSKKIRGPASGAALPRQVAGRPAKAETR